MNKFVKVIMATALTMAMVVGFTSCKTVKDGSVIKTCTVQIKSGENTYDVAVEFYMNFAPITIEHVTYLADKGYYDNSAVSNIKTAMEFGEYVWSNGALSSKYASGATNGYYTYITKDYANGKKALNGALDRYYGDELRLFGEFADNGFTGNKLTFDGALVLKRDRDTSEVFNADTGRATLAFVFGAGSFYDASSQFAIMGKLVTDDNCFDGKSSYALVKSLIDDNVKDEDGNSYYYFAHSSEEYDIGDGYLMKDSNGDYFMKDADKKYTVKIDEEEDESFKTFFEDLSEYADDLMQLPVNKIEIVSFKVNK